MAPFHSIDKIADEWSRVSKQLISDGCWHPDFVDNIKRIMKEKNKKS